MNNIVRFENIEIVYKMKNYNIKAIDNVRFEIKKGKITALVGESGSGKTTLANGILNSILAPGEITNGNVIYIQNSKSVSKQFSSKQINANNYETIVNHLNVNELNRFRWKEVSMVFQGAQSCLNPVENIFNQFKETIKFHQVKKLSKKELNELTKVKLKELLELVNLDYERVRRMHPHELSGGMKQRVMIALSLLLDPQLIILDEPTTALDVITQDYIFSLLKKINRKKNTTMLLLTHDIGVVAKYSDYMGVLYAGKLVEYASTKDIFKNTKHPYSIGLIKATPSLKTDINLMESIPGSPPELTKLPKGCAFHPRCSKAFDVCKLEEPKTFLFSNNHCVKCHLFSEDFNNEENN